MYIIDRELIKSIPWKNDPIDYDYKLFKLGNDEEEFIVPNPNIAVDLDDIVKKIPTTNRCIVWYYQDIWIAKKFNNKWRPEYGYYDIQVPTSSLKFNYLWIRNPDLEEIEFDSDPYRKYLPTIDESYYELVWYLDPKHSPTDDKIWVVKCKNHNADCLGTKDMGYLSPPTKIVYNPLLPNLSYDIDYKIPWWELNYTYQWLVEDWILPEHRKENTYDDLWAYKISFVDNPVGTKFVGRVSPSYEIEFNDELPKMDYNIEYSIPYYDLEYEHIWMLDKSHCENAVEDIWAVKIRYVDKIKGSKIIGEVSPLLSLEYNPSLPDLSYDINYNIPYYDLAYEHVWMLDKSHCENAVEDIWAAKISATDHTIGTKIIGEISPCFEIIYNDKIPEMEYEIDYEIPYHDLGYDHLFVLDKKHTKTLVDDIWAFKITSVPNPVGTKIIQGVSPKLQVKINKDLKGYKFVIPAIDIQYHDLDYNHIYMLDKQCSAGFDIWAIQLSYTKTKSEKLHGEILPTHIGEFNPSLDNLKINLDYKIPYHDRLYNHVWYLDEKYSKGEKIWAVKMRACDKPIGQKEMGIITPEIKDNLDVVFISYNELEADKNFLRVLEKAPHAKRVHGVEGIFEAHKAAAKIAKTDMFYVVDGDAWLVDDWNFDYQPGIFDRDCTYVWHSKNPINGLTYGHGGVKLFSRSQLLKKRKWKTLDMTTGIMQKLKVIEKVSNISAFDTDEFSTWKSAFRECIKLLHNNDSTSLERFKTWKESNNEHKFGKIAVEAANYAEKFYKQEFKSIPKINDMDWLKNKYTSLYLKNVNRKRKN